jgi:microcystin-dependent protein
MGAETVTLTSAQSGLPAHSHNIATQSTDNGGGTASMLRTSTSPAHTYSTNAVSAANASEAHSNIQPTIVKYVWQRTA